MRQSSSATSETPGTCECAYRGVTLVCSKAKCSNHSLHCNALLVDGKLSCEPTFVHDGAASFLEQHLDSCRFCVDNFHKQVVKVLNVSHAPVYLFETTSHHLSCLRCSWRYRRQYLECRPLHIMWCYGPLWPSISRPSSQG